jgi:predicted transposase/invertase (TIGR01784 family)
LITSNEYYRTLAQYGVFVGKVRGFQEQDFNLDEAVKMAVVYCREHDILKEFLEQNAAEDLNMLMTEWVFEDALDVRYEEGVEKGMEKGREESMEEVARNALENGLSIELIHALTGLDEDTIKSLQP